MARAPTESLKDISKIFESVFSSFSLEVHHHDGNVQFEMKVYSSWNTFQIAI